MRLHGHAKADQRHRHLHRVALEKLRLHPELLPLVLALLDRWLQREEWLACRRSLEQWRQMLTSWPQERMRATVLNETEGQVLRQCSPLGPVLTPQERWAALREVEGQSASQEPPASA